MHNQRIADDLEAEYLAVANRVKKPQHIKLEPMARAVKALRDVSAAAHVATREPRAWESATGLSLISHKDKKKWEAVWPEQVNHFTVPLYDHPAPLDVVSDAAAGEPIYQCRENVRADTWKDCSKDAHDHMAKYPACFETRTVHTAPQSGGQRAALTEADIKAVLASVSDENGGYNPMQFARALLRKAGSQPCA